MRLYFTLLKIEAIKVRRSKILIGTIGFFVFMSVIIGLFTLMVKHPELTGNSSILNAKASMLERADWPSYFGLLIQIILTAGTFGFGISAGWIFGREFVDNVVKDLLALPVSRTTIVLAKFTVLLVWNMILAVIVLGVSMMIGAWVGLDSWSSALAVSYAGTFLVCSGLTILLCSVISFFASVSRGYLLPIGIIILTMIVTQMAFVATPTLTPYIPWAIPALYSGVAGPAMPGPGFSGYLVLGLTCLAGVTGTAAWWRFADQA